MALRCRRSVIAAVCCAAALLTPAAPSAQQSPAQPIFTELFAYDPADPAQLLRNWRISAQLDSALRPLRVGVVADPIGHKVGRVTVEAGDGLYAGKVPPQEAPYVCDGTGSRAREMETAGEIVPTERAEIQLRTDRATGADEVVKFGETVWYRFSFKIGGDWPHDMPAEGRLPCRTVIHQVKQDASKDGRDCGASPFFKIEARPLGDRVRFFGQVYAGSACSDPPRVMRAQICGRDLPRETWIDVAVRLHPAHTGGRVDLWLDGVPCGTYQGPMADPENGVRRDGLPFVNTQPRFGIYRDRRAETQTIYFDKIMFWSADPTGDPDWGARPLAK